MKVSGVETEFVVSHAGKERDNASGRFAELDGIAGGLDVDGAHCVGTDAEGEVAADRGANVESIEEIERGVGLRSCEVDLPGDVLDYAWVEGEEVADVA